MVIPRSTMAALLALSLLTACNAGGSLAPSGPSGTTMSFLSQQKVSPLRLGAFQLFGAPQGSGDALNLDVGPDSNFYYPSNGSPGSIGTTIVQFSSNGQYQVFQIPQGDQYGINATNIVNGPDGRLWFGTYSCIIDAMTTGGTFQQYTINPNLSCTITLGPTVGQNIWLTYANTLNGTSSVGYFNTSNGAITLFPVASSTSNNIGEITQGPDGNFWFAYGRDVGRVTPSGTVSLFPSQPGIYVSDVLSGPDGSIWFCGDGLQNVVGRMKTSGHVQSETTITGNLGITYQMTIGPDNKVWISSAGNQDNGLLRFTSGTRYHSFIIRRDIIEIPSGITTGPDKNIWFYTYGRGDDSENEGMGTFIFSQPPKRH
jgi:streptogramin lyase